MRLKRIEVNAFGGINPESPVVIDFSESKWVTVSGDMGTRKTSLLNALLVACGQLSKDANDKAFVNKDSNKININFDFVGKDRANYNVRITKSSFTLTYDGVAVPEPITKMKELLGVVGVSPMDIKNAKIQDIVKWLAAYTNKSAEEYEFQMRKYKDNAKKAVDSRAAANKIVAANDEYLADEPLAQNWEESEKKYSTPINIDKLLKERDTAENDYKNFTAINEGLEKLKTRAEEIEEQINKLTAEAVALTPRIEAGEKWVKENESVIKLYINKKEEFDNAATKQINYNKWQEIKRKKAERDEAETLSQKVDSQEKELKKKMADLRAEILPDIKGVELVTEDTHENGHIKKEGLYWNGLNSIQMSESEWWSLVIQIWRKYKVKIIVIDNMQSLGSKGVELLEKLHNDGAYILAAQMDRKKKELQISYE